MNISLNIQADTPAELTQAIKHLAAAYGDTAPLPADPPKEAADAPKKIRAKAETSATNKAADAPAVSPAPTDKPDAPTAKKIDVAEVRQAIGALLKATNDADTAAFLNKFGATRLSELKEADYPQIIAEAKALIDAAASNAGMMD